MNDRAYWILRNLVAFILNLCVAPIYYPLLIIEDFVNGMRTVFSSGAETMLFPWEIDWPFCGDDE